MGRHENISRQTGHCRACGGACGSLGSGYLPVLAEKGGCLVVSGMLAVVPGLVESKVCHRIVLPSLPCMLMLSAL